MYLELVLNIIYKIKNLLTTSTKDIALFLSIMKSYYCLKGKGDKKVDRDIFFFTIWNKSHFLTAESFEIFGVNVFYCLIESMLA